jgi:hypothetical protein
VAATTVDRDTPIILHHLRIATLENLLEELSPEKLKKRVLLTPLMQLLLASVGFLNVHTYKNTCDIISCSEKLKKRVLLTQLMQLLLASVAFFDACVYMLYMYIRKNIHILYHHAFNM